MATSTSTFFLYRAADQLMAEVLLRNLAPVPEGNKQILRRVTPNAVTGITVTLYAQHVLDRLTGAFTQQVTTEPTLLKFFYPLGQDPGVEFSIEGILGALPKLALAAPNFAGLVDPNPSEARQGAPREDTLVPAEELVLSAPTDGARGVEATNSYLLDLARRGAAEVAVDEVESVAATAPSRAATVEDSTNAIGVDESVTQPEVSQLNIASLLTLSGFGEFDHAAKPVTRNGLSELWHTRLVRSRAEQIEHAPDLVAIKASPNTLDTADISNMSSLLLNEAMAIATQTQSDAPLRARYVHLSSLGASTDLRGEWPTSTSVKAWRLRTAVGRDQHQQLVQLGTLYPFGHQAILTSVTQRKIDGTRNAGRAGLVKKERITVRNAVVNFGDGDAVGRQFPFSSIELLTLVTPESEFATLHESARYPAVGPTNVTSPVPFQFQCIATDRAGRPVRFDAALVFVPSTFPAASHSTLVSKYRSHPHLPSISFDGQTIAVARPSAASSNSLAGSSSAVAAVAGQEPPRDGVDVITALVNLDVVGGAAYRPIVSQFTGRLPGVERLAPGKELLKLAYHHLGPNGQIDPTSYLVNGFGGSNVGEALLALKSAGPSLGLSAREAAGGLVSNVAFDVTGLSRQLGPVGGQLAKVAAGQFDPKAWLGNLLDELKLFGVVALKDLIDDVGPLEQAPRIGQTVVDGLRNQQITWSTPLFASKPELDLGVARVGPIPGIDINGPDRPTLTIEALVTTPGLGNPQTTMTASTTCTITNLQLGFGLGSGDLVTVPFKSVSFKTVDGRKPDIDVRMGRIGFHGVLEFVGVLADLVDQEGFHDPPALDLTSDGITSSFSTPIPSIAVGMFSLENISFGAKFSIFFNGSSPELALNFATFDNPFHLTVSALGGGGFLGLAMDTNGLKRFEGSLEFGASLSLNLVVTKGSVSAMGGVYFLIDSTGANITGFLRVKGHLSVLGLISVGVELFLALAYRDGLVRGIAELSIKIKLLFFKKTVRITMERTFAGSNGDPTFAELMGSNDQDGKRAWDNYCLAFAA